MSDFNPVNTADDRLRVLAGRVAALPPAQRELLRAQLEARGIAWTDVAAMPPSAPGESTASTGELPLSAAQRHLWVVHQLQPDTSAYHIALTWTLTGPLEVPALQQALQQVVERHDALRTVFLARDGKPYQRVLPHVACLLGVSDLRAPALAGIEAERIRQIALQPFDLTQAPLVRAQLLRTAEERHVLVLVLHHLVADGWSRGVLLRELAAGYRAAREDRATTAIPLTYQYSDYVRDQQAWLESAECRRQTAYWKTQLAALTPLDLPSDRPRGRAMEQPARTATRTLPSTLRPLLRAAGVQCGATPFMLLLTAFDVLLHRYTGRSDIAVGIPVAGRTGPQTADLIGFFVNTLVIRARADAAATFTDWLDIVKRAVADAFDHGDLPLANVVDAVVTTRDPGRNPLFDVMFQYQSDGYRMQNAAAPGLAFPGLHMSQDGIELAHTKFDMSWHVLDREDGLLLAVEYRTDLFDDARIERMLDHFTVLVEAALREPARHVGALPLLTEAERTRIAAWQRGPAPVGSGTPAARWAGLVERFERQVDRTPDARAAASPDGALSYRDLDAAANRVARHLIDRGVGAESRVGVCLPRTPQLLAMLLGVLKAGAAYVPLDPALPERRLRFMIDDAQLAVLIAGETEVARLYPVDAGTDGGPALLVPDRDRPVLDACADTRIARSVWPEQLAYVLYTSGSTGTPKGTQLTHGGLMHYLDWCLARYPVAAGQGAPVHSSIGFDATITGLFAPLLAGRAVMLLPDDASLVGLASALRADHGFVKLTPAHLAALPPLLEAQPLPADARLPRAFVIGGEALNESHVSFWRDRYPAIALLNEYGPTETVVGCCVHEVEPGDRGSIPIGRPIAGAALYLLDGHLQPVPVGVTGEICIGGAGVARGYLHRPDLTAERFVPDPFGARGCVMYRTGDLARYRSDGVVEYLGRADQQVQLRGYRIEIGEVEAALSRQPEIAETVVVLHVVGAAPALVAYLRVVDGTTVDVPALRQRLAQWLPPYMVPGHFVVLDAFALTANGKVDRAALPAPVLPAGDTGAAVGNAAEQRLLAIWRDVLGRQDIGIHDNFFDRGGDSVSGMQIVAQAHRDGMALTPAQIFEHQTVAGQAAAATAITLPNADATTAATGAAPLSPMQWAFLGRGSGRPQHHNQSLLLDVDPALDAERLRAALQTLVDRHDALRLRFEAVDDGGGGREWRQWHADRDAVSVPLQRIDLSTAADPLAALRTAIAAAQAGLDLTDGPLFHAVLFDLGTSRGARLLLVAHHLVVDGVSWRVLLLDLVRDVDTLRGGSAVAWAEGTGFGTWTTHLAAERPRFEAEVDHWLRACRPSVPLPLRVVDAARMVEGDVVEAAVALDAEATADLLGPVPPRLAAGIDDILLTALAQTLCQWTRGDAVTVDVESHGRQGFDARLDVSRTVGWFTAQYPLRLEVPRDAVERQLDAVKACRGAVPNAGIGYGVLRMAGRVPASPATVSFNYLGRIELPATGFIRGLAAEPVPAQRDPAAARGHALEVVAFVRDGQLQMLWRHHPAVLEPTTIAMLARRCVANLRSLIAVGGPSRARAPTRPTAAPAEPTDPRLRQLMARLKSGDS